jgi:hypothetical protein
MADDPTTTETEVEEEVTPAVEAGATVPETKAKAKAAAAKIDVTLSDAQLDRVADRVVDKFEANGAFEKDEPPPADGDGEAGAEGEETIPPKKTWAQKFAGMD